jgi:hypothetical protein
MGNTAGVIERSRNCLHFTSIWVHPRSFDGVRVAHIFSFCVVQLCFFFCVLSSVLWGPIQFQHNNYVLFAFTSSCCRRAHVLLEVFVFACAQWCPTHIVKCLMYPMLPLSLGCPFLISPSIFSNVYCEV